LIKSIAPISTAMAAAAARASALRANSGFDVYERVAPLGRVIVRMHRFSARIRKKEKKGGQTKKKKRMVEKNHLLSFPSSSMIS
jgi:hypothetical protein